LEEFLKPLGLSQNRLGLQLHFHNRLRDECLNCEELWGAAHARVVLESRRSDYSTVHLHSSLGDATPAEFAAAQPRPVALVPA
jgi:hypothetical protein